MEMKQDCICTLCCCPLSFKLPDRYKMTRDEYQEGVEKLKSDPGHYLYKGKRPEKCTGEYKDC